ncbi:squalene/phytoene synthase family protein [Verrucomicrobia bacterium]|nr:squalene/phytoene synthase family protein [Verrucomicrobiota bacterium]
MQVGESITRRSASNLAFAFIMLPAERRRSMCSLYAFCREVDDVADADEVPTNDRRQALLGWREDVRLAATGGAPEFPVNQELKPVIERYGLSLDLFDELLKGVESDLDTFRYQTDADLQAYCYRVASVVGLLSIEIFGYQSPQCHEYAVKLGLALQYIIKKIEAVVVRLNQGFNRGKMNFRKGRKHCPMNIGKIINLQSFRNMVWIDTSLPAPSTSNMATPIGTKNTDAKFEIVVLKTAPATSPRPTDVKKTAEVIVVGKIAK